MVVLATGSRPAPERLGGTVDGSIPVLSIDEAVGRSTFSGPVLFVDLRGDLESALCAEHVAAAGAELTLVTPYLSVGPNLGFTHLADVVGRLARLGASLEASTAFAGIAARQALTRHLYTRGASLTPVRGGRGGGARPLRHVARRRGRAGRRAAARGRGRGRAANGPARVP